MTKKVNYAPAVTREHPSLIEKYKNLLDKTFNFGKIEPDDLVGIKIHFGEEGNTAYIRPIFIKILIEKIKERDAQPFLTDTTTLYHAKRHNGVTALELAYNHGFNYSTLGAPLIIGDGIRGKDYFEIEIQDYMHFDTIKLANVLQQMDALFVASHFKGHMVSGFGGAIKNISMGLGSRAQKQKIHADFNPHLDDEDECRACGICIEHCPVDCITLEDGHTVFDLDECIGCAECVAYCPYGAVKINWNTDKRVFNQKLVETAGGVTRSFKGPIFYLNYLLNITPDCDCLTRNDIPMVPDIGILAAEDPVAIDAASMKFFNEAPVMPNSVLDEEEEVTKDKIASLRPELKWRTQLDYGEKIGLGSQDFEIGSITS